MGEVFHPELKKIGEIRSLLPNNVNVMALTATAKTSSQLCIKKILGMKNPAVVEVSPEKSKIFLSVQQFKKLQKSFEPLVKKLISVLHLYWYR